MPGIEREVEAADPPTDAEPGTAPAVDPSEPDGEAECEPRDEDDERGLEEHRLRLREPTDAVERQHCGQK